MGQELFLFDRTTRFFNQGTLEHQTSRLILFISNGISKLRWMIKLIIWYWHVKSKCVIVNKNLYCNPYQYIHKVQLELKKSECYQKVENSNHILQLQPNPLLRGVKLTFIVLFIGPPTEILSYKRGMWRPTAHLIIVHSDQSCQLLMLKRLDRASVMNERMMFSVLSVCAGEIHFSTWKVEKHTTKIKK